MKLTSAQMDELIKELDGIILGPAWPFTDAFWPWLEQKLSDREAATVERCVERLAEELAAWKKIFANEAEDALMTAIVAIRALSPDPNWLDNLIKRETLKAKMDEACYWQHFVSRGGPEAGEHRIADLDRQLDEMGKESQGGPNHG